MKRLALGILLPVLLMGSFFVNIYIHEYGHYFVADHYGLEPEVHFEPMVPDGDKFSFFSPSAYVSYSSDSTELVKQDAIIAFAGPFINLVFALVVCAAYLAVPKKKRTFWVQACFIMLAVPAFISFAINLIPVGYTDGSIIVNALLG